ncbi:MAG: C45 family autoproteolytic acyltransferase/hydrolase [Bacillota bacterium]
MKPARPIPYLKVKGSAYELGFQHGRAFDQRIRTMSAQSLAWVERTAGVARADLLSRVRQYVPFVEEATPYLIEEVRGIADGAAIPFEETFALQARFELVYTPAPECTVFGAAAERTRDGKVMIGQNMDLPPEDEENIILLHLVPNDGRPEILTATVCGILSQEGINSAGLALCGSLVVSRNWRVGYPNRNFLRRFILEQQDIPAALRAIERVPHRAAGHHLVLADAAGRIIDLEQTPDTYRTFGPEQGILAHANHYLHPDLVPEEGLHDANPRLYRGSVRRRNRMRQLLEAHEGPLDVESLHAILSDHGDGPETICAHAGEHSESKTVISVVAIPQERTLWVGLGNPCESGMKPYFL